MNLSELVQNKIEELGATKASKYFGVSVPTIYSWKKKGNAPIEAAQKLLDENPLNSEPEKPTETVAVSSSDGQFYVKNPEAPVIWSAKAAIDTMAKNIEGRFNRIELAILNGNSGELRQWKMAQTDPDRNTPLTSGIHPFRNPESGIKVDSPATVIDPQNRAPDKKDWNQGGITKAPSWNAPVNPTAPRNPGGDWNRPMPKE